jgi:uncharacterized protein
MLYQGVHGESNTMTRRNLLAALAAAPAAAQPSRPLVIDAHCHAGTGTAMQAPWNTRADHDITLRHMAEAGIDRTVVFPINNQEYGRANRELSEICKRYPDKFIGLAKHDPQTEAGRIAEMLRREVKTLGLRGLKLHRLPTREVMDVVRELGIPILYHPEKVANFHMVAAEYPDVPLIMAHLGNFGSQIWTEHVEAIEVAKRYRNVYLETSSVVFFKFLRMAADEVGPDRLIFGSDGPELDSRVELYKVKLLKLAPAAEAKVVGGNIARLLKLA